MNEGRVSDRDLHLLRATANSLRIMARRLRADEILDVISDVETKPESEDSIHNESQSDDRDSDNFDGGEHDNSDSSEASVDSSDSEEAGSGGSTATMRQSTAFRRGRGLRRGRSLRAARGRGITGRHTPRATPATGRRRSSNCVDYVWVPVGEGR